MVDLNSDYTVEQWGRQTSDGVVTWQTAEGWAPAWSTPEGRAAERQTYADALVRLGVTPDESMNLTFLTREKHVTYTPAEVVTDEAVIEDQEVV